MLLNANLVGQQQMWALFTTRTDQHERPLLKMIRPGGKPVNKLYNYQAKTFNAPTESNQPEGKDWTAFGTPLRRVELKARVHRSDITGAVSVMAQDVHNVAGVDDELADDILDRMEEMQRSIECYIGSERAAYEDDGVTQDRTQGMGLWIQNPTTNQLYATPASVRPPAASIYTGTDANLNEGALRTLLQSQWKETGQTDTLSLILGESLKERIDSWSQRVLNVTDNTMTRRSTRSEESKTLGYEVQTYRTVYGTVETHLSRWLEHPNFGGNVAKGKWRGFGIHPDRWALLWNTKPRVEKLSFQGGSYKYGAYAIWMLACWTPLGEIGIDISDPT